MTTTNTTIATWAMRPSVRPITASTTTTRVTCSSQSTTSTPMTTFAQMFAWCTWYTELAHSAHSLMSSHTSIGSRCESLLLFYFHLSFPVFFFSFHLLHCELFSELDNLIAMESLCYSANKGSDDAYDVSTSLTESGCPIFRATTPFSRGKLKSKGHGKLSVHFAADHQTIETLSHNCFCQSAQSLRSSCKHVWRIWIPSRSIRATWCIDGTINCSHWNQSRSSFG